MRMMSLPALLLLLATAAGKQCSLTMWVFQDYPTCIENPASPLSEATIYADKTCHTVETSSNAELFPGTYVAECLPNGRVEFSMSGCTNSECTASSGDPICDQSFTSVSPFYSLVNPNNYPVQDPAKQGSSYICTRTTASSGINFTVGFAIFGDCSTSECQGGAPAPSPVGTPSPTQDVGPPIIPPISNPTSTADPPSVAPVTKPPTLYPTETEVTDSPTESPSSPPPTLAPFPRSTSMPTTAPVETTNAPMKPPVTTLQPSSSSIITDRVEFLSLVLTKMSGSFVDKAEELEWQNVTAAHIESFNNDDNVQTLSVKVTIASQQMTPSGSGSGSRRRLASSYSLQIDFVADVSYGGEKVDGNLLIASSFDSDQDRTAYIDQLQAENNVAYKNLDKVEFLDPGKPLPAEPVSAESELSLGIIIGAAVGGVAVLGLATFWFLTKKRAEKTREVITPMTANELSPEKSAARELPAICQDDPAGSTDNISSLYTCNLLEALDLCSVIDNYTRTKGFTANQACSACGGRQNTVPTTDSTTDSQTEPPNPFSTPPPMLKTEQTAPPPTNTPTARGSCQHCTKDK